MANRYPPGMVDWIRENYINMTLPELTEACNERFGLDMNKKAMSSLKKGMDLPVHQGKRCTAKCFLKIFATL